MSNPNYYRTEIFRKPAKNNQYAYSTEDFEQVQKNQMKGQLYDQVSDYYRKLIDSGKAFISFGYLDHEGVEYAHVGIFDSKTGEQVL